MLTDRRDPETPDRDREVLGHLQTVADVGFWELDLRTEELYLSTQVYELLGIDEPRIEAYLTTVHPDDVELLQQVYARARMQPGPYRVRHRTVDGERVLQIRVQSMADATGTPVRLLGVISDATAEWQLEQALEAATSARLTGILAGGAVHDLKNIFTVVLGHAQLVGAAEERGQAPDSESVAALQRAATRGLELTSQLLQVGRTRPVAARRVSVAELLGRLEVTAATALGRHRRVVVDAGPGGIDLLADESRLERVVVDLLLNARDALPPGEGTVRLSFRPLADAEVDELAADRGLPAGSYGVIEVADDGSGIAPEVLAHVTDPFFTTKAATGGTGIGLHTVARFVEAAGGALVIDSEPGAGTAVRLVLPTRESALGTGRRRTAAVRALVHGAAEARVQELCRALEGSGVQVVPSTSVTTSTAILRTEPIDLLVSDTTAPGDDARLLRAAGATSTPVLGVGELVGTTALDHDALRAVVDAVDDLLGRLPQRVRG